MTTDLDALAHAWNAGFDAASARAARILLLAAAVGHREATRRIEAEGPVQNPYRISKPGGGAE